MVNGEYRYFNGGDLGDRESGVEGKRGELGGCRVI